MYIIARIFSMAKTVYVIAGPNGAGKTTFARKFLPLFAHMHEFINPDLIATGLSPFAPQNAALRAGRLVLERISELAHKSLSFGFETTLSGKGYLHLFQKLHDQGYTIDVFYLWLPDEKLAIQRVQDRVKLGGHFVPTEDVKRRFYRGLRHFLVDYRPFMDNWFLFDNSQSVPQRVAFGTSRSIEILKTDTFGAIEKQVQHV